MNETTQRGPRHRRRADGHRTRLAARATEIARRIAGVRDVNDEIELRDR